MAQAAEPQASRVGIFDSIARDLQALRIMSGDVPYAEIVRRIGQARERAGEDPSMSRPARTTVYDVFRVGRTRINAKLVAEIASALGATEEEAREWEMRCIHARLRAAGSAPASEPEPITIEREKETRTVACFREAKLGSFRLYILLAACLVLNLFGFWLVDALGIRLYLDMVGTAVAAIACGPWAGVLVGIMTNVIGLSITDSTAAAFGIVNATGALIWGNGARIIRRNGALPKYVLLNVVVAFACSVISSVILVALFGGMTGHASEATMQTILASTSSLTLAVFNANLMYSLVDKMLTGFIVIALLGTVKQWVQVPMYDHVSQDARDSLELTHLRTSARFRTGRIRRGAAVG